MTEARFKERYRTMSLGPCVCGHEAARHRTYGGQLRPHLCRDCSCAHYTLEGECWGRPSLFVPSEIRTEFEGAAQCLKGFGDAVTFVGKLIEDEEI